MGLFGGGGSNTTVTNVSNVTVSVDPQITNTIVNDDSRLQSMVDAIVSGGKEQRESALVLAKTQLAIAETQQEATDERTEKFIDLAKNAVITAVIGFAVTQYLRRA